MEGTRYMKSLWIGMVLVCGCIIPLMAQKAIPTGGGSIEGEYKLTTNTTVTSSLSVASGKTATIDLNGYVLQGNFANGGPVLSVSGNLTIKDSRPTIDHAGHLDENGVFIWGTDGQTMSVNGGIIYCLQKDGKSTKGIDVSGTCVIEEAKIMGCYSTDIGAAVTVTSGGSFTMKKGEIRYNYSEGDGEKKERAGVIYGEPSHKNQGSIINISNTVISDNHTLGNGGAICGYKVTLNNCTIERNTTTKNGGAIYVRKTDDSTTDAFLTLTSCEVNNNEAVNGGAIFAETGASTKIDGLTTFSRNKATSNGGAVYAAVLNINGSAGNYVQIMKNEANQGGGIFVNGKFDIEYCNLESNYAKTNGGGIFATNTTDAGFTSTMSNSTVQKNRAMSTEPAPGSQEYITDENGKRKSINKGRGGGFYFQGKDEDLSNVKNPVFTLSNTTVTNNACMYYGGGGQVCTGATLNLNSGSRIDNNEAVLHGAGGLHVTATAKININSGSISYNKAYTVGGAIHSSYGCELNFYGGVIQGNYAHQRGGGVHINTGGEMLLQGTQIIGNRVERGLDMQYSTVTENDGIYSWTTPVAETTNSGYVLDADGNVQYSGYGGGVMIDSGTFTMTGGLISGNEAEIGGGGVALVMIRIGDQENSTDDAETKLKKILQDDRLYNYKVANFNLQGGQITKNKTIGNSAASEEERLGFEIGNGAGVYIMENNLKSKLGSSKLTYEQWQTYYKKTDDATITDGDKKYAVYEKLYDDVSKATVSGGSITNNEATGNGGALFLQQGIVDMDNLTMTANRADGDGGGLHLDNGTLTIGSNTINKITDNTATNGGGVCIANGTLSIGYCDIKQNTASQFGGGVYVANTENIEINLTGGGVFSNNTALAGGGMAVGGNIKLNFEGSLQNNTADNGGGIYLLPGKAQLIYKSGFIRNNIAKGTINVKTGFEGTVNTIKGFGGGAFLETGTTLSFDIKNSNSFGFYNNLANTGGDDIFANGKETTVALPDVSKMNLTGFDVPTTNLYWVEDYVTADTKYADKGSNMIAKSENTADGVRRYRDALRMSQPIYKIESGSFEEVKNKYLCLALGYKILYLTIKKIGLQDGESAIFDVYNKNKLLTSALLIGDKEKIEEGVIQKVAVPDGATLEVKENSWTWNYNQTEVSHQDGIIIVLETQTDEKNTITFTNTLIDEDKRKYDEAIKVNTMGGTSTTAQ